MISLLPPIRQQKNHFFFSSSALVLSLAGRCAKVLTWSDPGVRSRERSNFRNSVGPGPNLTTGGVGGLDGELDEVPPEDLDPAELVVAAAVAAAGAGAGTFSGAGFPGADTAGLVDEPPAVVTAGFLAGVVVVEAILVNSVLSCLRVESLI